LANSHKTQVDKDLASRMVCTNNLAEGPFAIVRAFLHMYPSLKLRTLAGLSGALVNGTHRAWGIKKETAAGIAITASTRLREAITKLCSVWKKQLPNFLSKVDDHGGSFTARPTYCRCRRDGSSATITGYSTPICKRSVSLVEAPSGGRHCKKNGPNRQPLACKSTSSMGLKNPLRRRLFLRSKCAVRS
jgi:hypothetical protein